MEYVKYLRAFPLLSKIGDEDLKALAGLLKEHKTAAGENVITEGDVGAEMYILIEGSVDIIKTTVFGDKFVVATLNADDHCVFGEMAMIDNDKRSATVRAKTNCKTLSIDHASFERFCDERPQSGVELLRLISINLVRNIRTENNNLRMVYQALIEEIEMG
ncbi:MAG: cyclic nucleotide-binding domain-containing protein [Lachnospiraceae bacterium]|nr:cyclic nucleotide-binding domain-containing protein [Lachnospiraceae bacterium]MBP5263388.1 cyclic nucleotide-binding domain-containing protein [Lachnospiraceae bacterium]MBP5668914.1 cyclic nucleotide-binding domain-containing protein [Lachnospiraceae bacterium]MBQ6094076.1 cyclic nucleotide-binding domain-containing protein [Lachnospiraceae bacterium]MBR3468185.1 cyclic nucleotide-binding domain-containing protein [Lachnospiraceae bacterium]